MNDPYELYLICWAAVLLGATLFLFVQLYFAYYKVDEILSCLEGASLVLFRKSFIGADPVSRIFFVNTVASMMLFPRVYIKSGAFQLDDFERVPHKLKIQLNAMSIASAALFCSAIVLWGVGEYMDR